MLSRAGSRGTMKGGSLGGTGLSAGRNSILLAALVVGVSAFLEAVITPWVRIGWVGPSFTMIGIVISTVGLRELEGMLLGFFGGVLLDALGAGIFGVGALSGLLAGFISVRVGTYIRRDRTRSLLAQLTFLVVFVSDLIGWGAARIVGDSVPSFFMYLFTGALPDGVANALLAFIIGGAVLSFLQRRRPT